MENTIPTNLIEKALALTGIDNKIPTNFLYDYVMENKNPPA